MSICPEMTLSQSTIFSRVKEFVLENRSTSSSKLRDAELSQPNTFSAGERAFLINLAQDLNLTLSWDEYDEDDQNLAILRFSDAPESPWDEQGSESDSRDEADIIAAVDLALRKYEEAKVLVETVEDNFDLREEIRLASKVDDWKRGYYWVWDLSPSSDALSYNLIRISSRYHMTTLTRWAHWFSVILRVCSG